MVRIKFYTKDGCWLCDAARETLNGFRERYGIVQEDIDIASNEELYELYRFDVPVIEFEDGYTLHSHIKRKALISKLEEMTKAGE